MYDQNLVKVPIKLDMAPIIDHLISIGYSFNQDPVDPNYQLILEVRSYDSFVELEPIILDGKHLVNNIPIELQDGKAIKI